MFNFKKKERKPKAHWKQNQVKQTQNPLSKMDDHAHTVCSAVPVN